MRVSESFTWIAIALILCAGETSSTAAASPAMPVFSFELSSPRIILNEPVLLQLHVRNTLSQAITFDLGLNKESNLQLMIKAPNKASIGPLRLSAEGFGRVGRVIVAPGEEYQQAFVLNRWYEFREPGKYLVTVKVVSSVKTGSETDLGAPPEQVLELTVSDRDPERLKMIAADLAQKAIHGTSYNDCHRAAESLAQINDSVAVPYLAQVLEQGALVKGVVVEGLARIGTREAVDALLTLLKSGSDPDLKAQAAIALRGVMDRTENPGLRDRIRDALRN